MLESETIELREKNNMSQERIEELTKDLTDMHGFKSETRRQMEHLASENSTLQSEVLAQLATIQKLNDAVKTATGDKDYLVTRLSSHHSLTTSMLTELVNLKNILVHTKEKNDALTFENEQLKMTLGSDVNELTPRPKWGVLQAEFRNVVSIDGRDPVTSEKASTYQNVRKLLKGVTELADGKHKGSGTRKTQFVLRSQQTKAAESPAKESSSTSPGKISPGRDLQKRGTMIESPKRTDPREVVGTKPGAKRHTAILFKRDTKQDSQSIDAPSGEGSTRLIPGALSGNESPNSKFDLQPLEFQEGFTPKSREVLLNGLKAKLELEKDLKLYDSQN